MFKDISNVSNKYKEYYSMGKGCGNLIDFGLYCDYDESIKYSCPEILLNGRKEAIDFELIREDATYSWLDNKFDEIIPGIDEPQEIDVNKRGAYSWVTAPRYKGYAVEGSPIARMILSGNYIGGISALDRVIARAMEAEKICNSAEELIERL